MAEERFAPQIHATERCLLINRTEISEEGERSTNPLKSITAVRPVTDHTDKRKML